MIINASPLIILGKLNKLDILVKIFKNIEIPEEVYNEIVVKGGMHTDSLIVKEFVEKGSIGVIKLSKKYSEMANKIKLIFSIDRGEAETIALAHQLGYKCAVIDEISAREAASSLNIIPIGTLGVLLIAFKKSVVDEDEIQKIVKEMMASKYRVGANIVIEFWNKLKELKQVK